MAFAMAINTFNKLRENNLIERDTLIDNRNIPLTPMQSYKYKVVTATGNVTLEDYKWLIGK